MRVVVVCVVVRLVVVVVVLGKKGVAVIIEVTVDAADAVARALMVGKKVARFDELSDEAAASGSSPAAPAFRLYPVLSFPHQESRDFPCFTIGPGFGKMVSHPSSVTYSD